MDARGPFVQVLHRDQRRTHVNIRIAIQVYPSTLIRRAVHRSQELATTANIVSAPTAHLNQLASTSDSTRPLSMTRISSAPTIAPRTVPTPPVNAVPPITAAATACNSSPSPIEGSGAPKRNT